MRDCEGTFSPAHVSALVSLVAVAQKSHPLWRYQLPYTSVSLSRSEDTEPLTATRKGVSSCQRRQGPRLGRLPPAPLLSVKLMHNPFYPLFFTQKMFQTSSLKSHEGIDWSWPSIGYTHVNVKRRVGHLGIRANAFFSIRLYYSKIVGAADTMVGSATFTCVSDNITLRPADTCEPSINKKNRK